MTKNCDAITIEQLDACLSFPSPRSENASTNHRDDILLRWQTYTLEELTRLGPLDDVTEREMFLIDKITTLVNDAQDALEV
jgi:hypothetical protein